MEQVIIALTGAIAIWLTQSVTANTRRWACIVGLIGQPFWLYATWASGQWGMFVLSVAYTVAWCRGVRTHWVVGVEG